MKAILPLAAAAALLAGCGKTDAPKPEDAKPAAPAAAPSAAPAPAAAPKPAAGAEPNYNTGNPLTAPVDYIGATVQAQKSATKVIDASAISQAIQMFSAQEGRLPKTLQELVPDYMKKLPTPPFGYEIVYDAATGTVKVQKKP